MLNGTLKPYLAYSAAAHAVLAVILAFILPEASSQPAPTYHIINLQASPGIVNRRPPSGSKRAKKKIRKRKKSARVKRPAPQKDPDVFDTRKRGPQRPLPRPSFLSTTEPVPAVEETEETAEDEIVEVEEAEEEEPGPSGPPSSLTAVDMTDFPYPWYVTQLRSGIWDRWRARLFSGSGECTVRFTLLRNGKAVDIRVEFTSGDKGFDYAALSAVRDATPFAPLPPRYKESFLNIHFEFKAR